MITFAGWDEIDIYFVRGEMPSGADRCVRPCSLKDVYHRSPIPTLNACTMFRSRTSGKPGPVGSVKSTNPME